MDEAIAAAVRARAGNHCEYCHLPAAYVSLPFEIEHVIAKQYGGTDALGNLAFTCLHCNRHKGRTCPGSTGSRLGPDLSACSTRDATAGITTSRSTARGSLVAHPSGESR